jgi:glycosyltransferase involved in cell wall biosynthesis
MKLLVLCPYVPHPPEHGGRIRSRLFLDTLAAHHEVQIAASCADDAERAAARALTETTGIAVHELGARAGARNKLAHWLGGRSELLARRWDPAARVQVRALLARERFGAIVADSTFVLPLLEPDPDVPVLQQLPNVEYAALARRDSEPGFAARVSRAVEARLIARCERRWAQRARVTFTASELDRRHLLALAPSAAVEVVENSVDLERLPLLPPTAASDAPLLLFVGSFDYPPNAQALRELLAEHLPALRAAVPGVRVRCIGSGLHGALAQLAAQPGVEAPGHVRDLLAHYREASAVYLPIRSGGGTRIKVLEALALGRPVIGTAIAVEGLDLEPDRHYLSCETPAAGARALQRVAAGGAAALAQPGRALVEARYAHAVVRKRIEALLGRWLEEPC